MKPINELAEYLGNNFEPRKMNWTNASDVAALEAAGREAFQRDKEALYLYTWRESADWWLPHPTFVLDVVPRGAALLDYKASTGWTGMRLYTDYRVSFAEVKNRCSDFLAWRLRQRGSDKVLTGDDIPLHDAVVSFDVANWMEEPSELVQELAALAPLCVLDADSRRVDVRALLDTISAEYRIINHRSVNHYVNLVAFHNATFEED